MSKGAIADALVAELRKLPGGGKAERTALRAAIGCSAGELKLAIDRLRFKGQIMFDRLALSPSMRAGPGPHPAASQPALSPNGRGEQEAAGEIEAGAGTGLGEAKKDDPARPEPDLAASPPPSGAELAAEIRAYCGRVGASLDAFVRAAVGYPGLLGNLKKYAPRPATVAKVRYFIAANPDGLPRREQAPDVKHYMPPAAPKHDAVPAPAPDLRAQVAAEAEEAGERRRKAIGGGSGAPLSPALRPAVEAIQSEAVALPGDLMTAIQRRHPQLMRRAVQLSRARGETPAAALYAALEAGLDFVEARVVAP